MQFQLSIDMDNAAFVDDSGELARILRSLADRLDANGGINALDISDFTALPVRDSNGNRVGVASITFE